MQNNRICDLLRVLFDNILIRHFSLLHSGLIYQMKLEEMEEFRYIHCVLFGER